MSWGTRVPFQTLSHSFSLKLADACMHERTLAHTHKQMHKGNERERCGVRVRGGGRGGGEWGER